MMLWSPFVLITIMVPEAKSRLGASVLWSHRSPQCCFGGILHQLQQRGRPSCDETNVLRGTKKHPGATQVVCYNMLFNYFDMTIPMHTHTYKYIQIHTNTYNFYIIHILCTSKNIVSLLLFVRFETCSRWFRTYDQVSGVVQQFVMNFSAARLINALKETWRNREKLDCIPYTHIGGRWCTYISYVYI